MSQAADTLSEFTLSSYPLNTYDKVRYADTDRQGHVNNAAFSTFLETGRVEVLYRPGKPLTKEGNSFVIASLSLDFRDEIHWPGQVDIGTGVTRIGKSSLSLHQGLFQDGELKATAETVIVQVDDRTKRSSPLNEQAVATLTELLIQP